MKCHRSVIVFQLFLLVLLIASPVFAGLPMGGLGEAMFCISLILIAFVVFLIIVPFILFVLISLFKKQKIKNKLLKNILFLFYVALVTIYFTVIYLVLIKVILRALVLNLSINGIRLEILFVSLFVLIAVCLLKKILNYIINNKNYCKIIKIMNIIIRCAAAIIGVFISYSLAYYIATLGHGFLTIALLAQIPGGLICGILQPLTNKPWLISTIFSPGIYFTAFLLWFSFSDGPDLTFISCVFVVLVGLAVPVIMCRIGIWVRS